LFFGETLQNNFSVRIQPNSLTVKFFYSLAIEDHARMNRGIDAELRSCGLSGIALDPTAVGACGFLGASKSDEKAERRGALNFNEAGNSTWAD
jgi:hypothetical protein